MTEDRGMARARIADDTGESSIRAVLAAQDRAETADRSATATAVRYLLQLLAEHAPGGTAEVRVPPFGAVQCIEGPRHTRGTPPNVIEMDAATWLALATGTLSWSDALADGVVHASGQRADLTEVFPILPLSSVR